MESKIKWEPIEMTPEEIAFREQMEEMAHHICRVFGISLQELGIVTVNGTITSITDDKSRGIAERKQETSSTPA